MKTPRGPGFATRLRIKFTSPLGDIRERIDGISKRFTGAGWKSLPQELVDEILGYLLDDLNALKACSLTCKRLFGTTRSTIHRRVCLTSRETCMERPKPKGFPFSLRSKGPEILERLVDANRSGLLPYIQSLTFKIEDGSFHPESMEKYLPYLRSITNLYTLTLNPFRANSFIPVFNECFGMFTNILRHLDLQNAYGTTRQLLYVISQFPLLEDLTIISPTVAIAYTGDPPPVITRSPPLRGTLVLVQMDSLGLPNGLAALPGGLNCSSLELFRCQGSQVVLDACGHSATSVSYMWCAPGDDPLNLKRSVVLERFEFTVGLCGVSQVHKWIHQTLRTITSPMFNELVIWILHMSCPWGLLYSMSIGGWKAVDALLDVLAGRNPDFRVVFRGDFAGDYHAIRQHIEIDYLPLSSLGGFVEFEQVSNVENRLFKSGVL